MKILPINFRKNGYDYYQLWRDDDYAIYRQSAGAWKAYEVFKINKNDATTSTFKDKDGQPVTVDYEASETVPPTTQWGKNAWTVATLQDAHDKVEFMKQEALNRVNTISRVPE